MKKRIIFRADGNLEIGYGHFIRSLGLAELLNDNFECVFAIQYPTEYQKNEINRICSNIIILSENHFDEFLSWINEKDIIVLDNYFFSSEYQLKIKEIGSKVIFIDDHNDKNYVCDVLINNIPGFSEESFTKKEYTKLNLGTDYALLRKEFLNPELRKAKKKENSFFLAFGGADIYNLSEKIIIFLNRINTNFEINLLIGDAYRYIENLDKFTNVKVHKNIQASEVAKLISQSNVCIVPASSLLNEVASIGSKTLIGYFSDNQIQPYEYFVDNNLAIGIGDYREVDFYLFKEKIEQVLNSIHIVENQRKIYNYQQIDNLKKIFYELQ